MPRSWSATWSSCANVIDVQDVTNIPSVARELALIKVRVADAGKRGELKQIADMFQSHVVDVAKDSMMIEVTGEETKVELCAQCAFRLRYS